jgi:hypothetical protein
VTTVNQRVTTVNRLRQTHVIGAAQVQSIKSRGRDPSQAGCRAIYVRSPRAKGGSPQSRGHLGSQGGACKVERALAKSNGRLPSRKGRLPSRPLTSATLGQKCESCRDNCESSRDNCELAVTNGNGTVTLINGGERIEVLIRFCPKVSYLSTCCGSNTCDKRTMPVTSHHKCHYSSSSYIIRMRKDEKKVP